MFLEALVCGKVTFLPLPPPTPFPSLSATHTLLFPTAGIPTVAPPTARPTPRPDVTPPPVGTFLLYAQGQQIGHLPLNGTRLQKDTAKTLLSLHVKWISPPGGGSASGFQIWARPEVEGDPGGFLGCGLREPDTQKRRGLSVAGSHV